MFYFDWLSESQRESRDCTFIFLEIYTEAFQDIIDTRLHAEKKKKRLSDAAPQRSLFSRIEDFKKMPFLCVCFVPFFIVRLFSLNFR